MMGEHGVAEAKIRVLSREVDSIQVRAPASGIPQHTDASAAAATVGGIVRRRRRVGNRTRF